MPSLPLGLFSVDVPEGWTLATVIVAGPPRPADSHKPFQANLVMTFEGVDAIDTAEAYYNRQLDDLRKADVGRREIGKPEFVPRDGGEPGLLSERVILGPSGDRVRQMQLIRIKDSVAATAIISESDGTPFEESRETFRRILLSI